MATLVTRGASDTQKYSSVPPLYISKLDCDLFQKGEEIKDVVNRLSIFSGDQYQSFEEGGKSEINGYQVTAYSAKMPNRDSLFTALQPKNKEDEDTDGSGQKEVLFFLTPLETGISQRNIYVLSTKFSYKLIECFCSKQFSRDLSTGLADKLVKIERTVAGLLAGPILESHQSYRGFLPTDVEQGGISTREMTLILNPFADCFDKNPIKAKFKDAGVLFYRNLNMLQYTDLICACVKRAKPTEARSDWNIPSIPTELIPVKENDVCKELDDQLVMRLIYKDALQLRGWEFDHEISHRYYKSASEYRLYYLHPNDARPYFYSVFFKNPFSVPSIDELEYALFSIYADKWRMGKTIVKKAFQDKKVRLEYNVDGVWMSIYVLDIIEGIVKTPQKQIYFRSAGAWYSAPDEYQKAVNDRLENVLTKKVVIQPDEKGWLKHRWGKSMTETAYNASFQKDPPGAGTWLEGNQKRKGFGCEIADIFHVSDDEIFIYHVKKGFQNTIRDAVTQIVMSAQLLYDALNHQGYTHSRAILSSYCQTVTGGNSIKADELFKALTNTKLQFVLAFSLPLSDSDYQDYLPSIRRRLLTSQSIIAKREVVRAKAAIESLGYEFKIAIIHKDETCTT